MRPRTQTPAKNIASPQLGDDQASDWMTEDPMVVKADSDLADALDMLREMKIRHLPVMDGDRMIGIISDRDLLGEKLQRSVRDVMNSNVISVRPDASLAQVIDALIENRIGAVPVIDERDEELVGIISYVDVLRAIRNELED